MAFSAARRAIRQSSQLAPPGTGRWRAQRTQTLASRRAWRRLRERILAWRRLPRGDFRPYLRPACLARRYRSRSAARRFFPQVLHSRRSGSWALRPHFSHSPRASRSPARWRARRYSAFRASGSLRRVMPASRRRAARRRSAALRLARHPSQVRPPSTGATRAHLTHSLSALTLPDGAMLTLFDGFRIVSLGDRADVG